MDSGTVTVLWLIVFYLVVVHWWRGRKIRYLINQVQETKELVSENNQLVDLILKYYGKQEFKIEAEKIKRRQAEKKGSVDQLDP